MCLGDQRGDFGLRNQRSLIVAVFLEYVHIVVVVFVLLLVLVVKLDVVLRDVGFEDLVRTGVQD